MTIKLFKNLPLGLTIAVGLALAVLIGLGTWQLQRLHWKQQLLADLERTRQLPPVAAETLLNRGGEVAWRQVTLPCPVDPQKVVYMHGIKEGVAGFHVLTLCPLGKDAIVADLGFATTKGPLDWPSSLSLTGRLRPYEAPNGFTPPNDAKSGNWYSRNVTDLSNQWNAKLRGDYFIAASQPVGSGVTPVNAAANLPNRHLEYALTWYGLAVALIGVYIAVLYQRARKGI
ncbi:SURF1 family protein [Asticcacaulis sp. BYS171W]|uniref:SURF1-like protein n=1 Tax=Asticcacaulis aquaticus TaxID=2984212 RepID=A0ABT5HYR3_9CAUL|nr:SURF1 family protein [Asticcacaulis aquaticus]MDC7685214.1 SURF1 family protein [Asticcacaulis aquaticus]